MVCSMLAPHQWMARGSVNSLRNSLCLVVGLRSMLHLHEPRSEVLYRLLPPLAVAKLGGTKAGPRGIAYSCVRSKNVMMLVP